MEKQSLNMPLADAYRLRIKSLKINRGYAVLGLRKWGTELYSRKIRGYEALLAGVTGRQPTQTHQASNDGDWDL